MKHLSRYIFVFLILLLVYMLYLVLSYKYTEYRIIGYMEELSAGNKNMLLSIEETKQTLEYKNTKAYKNKILKAERWLKNSWEEVVFLIAEKEYNKYTQDNIGEIETTILSKDLMDEKSLLATMTIYEKWIYLIFNRDIR